MVIDLHANLNVLLKYVDIYRKYLPVSSLSVQQKMQYKYNDKLLIDLVLKNETLMNFLKNN